jgi:Ca2+-binding RTX toxin-like protein
MRHANTGGRWVEAEALEERRLFASVEVTALGTMLVTGTQGPDVIRMRLEGAEIVTQINLATYRNPLSSVRRFINVQALDGNDRVEISGAITVAADVYGGRGNDTLTGGGGGDNLIGEDGDDLMYGGAGNDSLWGQAGRDDLYGQAGWDQVDYSDYTGPVAVSLDDAANDGGFYFVALEGDNVHSDIEDVIGSPQTDVLVGNDLPNRLVGGGGNDRLEGRGGDDGLWGEGGADRIYGGEGADRLYGGAGADRLYGEGGADLVWGEAGNDTIVPGSGRDIAWDGLGSDYVDLTDGEQDVLFHLYEGTAYSEDTIIVDRHYPRDSDNDDQVYRAYGA